LQENNASFAPYTQSRDLLVVGRIGDIEKMGRKMSNFKNESEIQQLLIDALNEKDLTDKN
jgi:hypothetical protein